MKQQADLGKDGVGVGKILVVTVLTILLSAAVLFAAAGTWRWPMAWVYLGVIAVSTLVMRLLVLKENPDLLQERAQASKKSDIAPWDRKLMPLVALIGPLVMLTVAGLDKRFAWSGPVPPLLVALALAVFLAGILVSLDAMVVNRFFSAVVRIQEERGHAVVDAGPYRMVRHPGYAGSAAVTLVTPILLNAWWAMAPALITVVLIVLRTAREDRLLRQELDGYDAYTRRVKYRLVPGIW